MIYKQAINTIYQLKYEVRTGIYLIITMKFGDSANFWATYPKQLDETIKDIVTVTDKENGRPIPQSLSQVFHALIGTLQSLGLKHIEVFDPNYGSGMECSITEEETAPKKIVPKSKRASAKRANVLVTRCTPAL